MAIDLSSHEERIKWHLILLVAVISFCIVASVKLSGLVRLFELKAYDLLTIYAAEEKENRDVVIIEFDQKTLDAFNEQIGLSFPWPRDIYEPVIGHLSKAKAVLIDIIFSEPSRDARNNDLVFNSAMEKAGNVFLALPLEKRKKKTGEISETDKNFLKKHSVNDSMPFTDRFNSAILPTEDLRNGVKGVGNVTLNPDTDGIYRTTPLFFGLNDLVIPQFAVSALMAEGRIRNMGGKISVDGKEIPLMDGSFLLQYGKNKRPFEEISFMDVFNSALLEASGDNAARFSSDYFKDKYVLIGYTLKGLYDLRATPVSSVSPGVFIHANLLDNLAWKRFLVPVPQYVIYIVFAVLSFVTVYFVMTTKSMPRNLLFFGIFFVFVILCSSWLFRRGLYLDPLYPLFSLTLAFITSAIFSYALEGRKRAFIRSTFSRYMDQRIVNHLLANPSLIAPGGTRCRCTVFFADIAGFTTISESISPEKTAQMLYKVLTTMTELIIARNGVIDKYIGDCIMAFWGAPVSGGEDEKDAVRAALACVDALGPINAELSEKGIPSISMRFGIHSGEVIVGNLGSERLFDYTVIGDTVNLASRLESVNKVFSTKIIVSESTREMLDDAFCLRVLSDIAVKGKSKAIRIFEVLGENSAILKHKNEIAFEYAEGVDFFYDKQFVKAGEVFSGILKKWPGDGPSSFFMKRCDHFINQPPSKEGWEVLKMDTK